MNIGIGNNEITQNYYNLSLSEKRREYYSEFYELIMVLYTLIKNKYPDTQLPPIENFNNIMDNEIDEDMYMTGLYEDLIVLKELIAYYLDNNKEEIQESKGDNHMNNKVITKDEQIKIGKNILSTYMECPEESLTITELTEDNAIYISQPIRGGGSIIVASDGSYLFFNSSISFDEALEEFRKGRRSN